MKGVLPWALLSVGLHLTLVLAVPPPQPPGTDTDSFTMVFEVVATTEDGEDVPQTSVTAVAATDAPAGSVSSPAGKASAATDLRRLDPEPAQDEPPPLDRSPLPVVTPAPSAPEEPVPEKAQESEPTTEETVAATEPAPDPREEEPVAVHGSAHQPMSAPTPRTEPNSETGPAMLPVPRNSAPPLDDSETAAGLGPEGGVTGGGDPVSAAPVSPIESPRPAALLSPAGSIERSAPGPGQSAVNLIPPSLRSGGKPRYPRVARRRGWEGVVLLWVRVDATGRVEEVRLERSSGHDALDQAALDSIQKWLFHPAQKGRKPVAGVLLVPIRFDLVRAG